MLPYDHRLFGTADITCWNLLKWSFCLYNVEMVQRTGEENSSVLSLGRMHLLPLESAFWQ